MVSNRAILIDNIDKIHTTEMGVDRIRRNLKSENVDVVEYCKDKIMDEKLPYIPTGQKLVLRN